MWDWNEDLGEMNYYPRKSKKEYPKQRVIPERAESGADPGHLRHSKRWWMQLEWHGQAGKEKPSYTWLCRELSGYQHWSLCHWICMSLNERKPSSDLHFKNITFCSVRRRDGKRRTPEYCSCEKVWRPRVEQEHYLQHMFPYLSCAALLCSLQLASRPPSFCTTMTISLAWHSVQKIMDNGNLMLAISHVQIHTWKNQRGVSITLFPLRMSLNSTSSYKELFLSSDPRTISTIVSNILIWVLCMAQKRQHD